MQQAAGSRQQAASSGQQVGLLGLRPRECSTICIRFFMEAYQILRPWADEPCLLPAARCLLKAF